MTDDRSDKKFTGFASNALLQRQIADVFEEFKKNNIRSEFTKFVWPTLRLLYSTVYAFAMNELPEDDEARKAFIDSTGQYIQIKMFWLNQKEANVIMDSVFNLLHAKGLLGFKPVLIERMEWTFDEIRKTDRVMR
jgi:hypothetical protein